MGTDKPVVRPAESAVEAIAPPGVYDLLPGALQELYRALHKTSIYPVGHPSIRGAIGRAHEYLVRALEDRPSVMVGVARSHLLVDRVPIADGPAMLGSLAQFLHDLDVAVVELRSGLSAAELGQFLLRLREARQAGRGGASLALALAEDKLENVRIFPLDYWGLSFGSHADRERNENATDIWEALVVNLIDPAQARSAIDPESLAAEANHQFVSQEGVGGGLLRDQFLALGERMGGMEDWQREALRSRVGRFVGALNPSLRQDLLRLDPQEVEDSLNMVAELADSLTDAALLDVLRDINRSGQRVHDQFLNFLNKMARLPLGPSPTAPEMNAVLHRWGISGMLQTEDAQTFRLALKEILSRRKDIECNPQPYQELLDDLAHRELPPAMKLLASRYRDPSDPIDVQAQAVELAVHLLQDGQGQEHVPGILAHVGASTDLLLDAGQFQPIRDAAVVARFLYARAEEGEDTRRAAWGYLQDFTLEPRIDRILDRALRGGRIPSAVEPLLVLGGRVAIDRIIDRLDADLPAPVASLLQSIAVQIGREPLSRVLEARKAEGWTRLRPAFPLLRLHSAQDALSLLESLACHPESRVRREVLTYRCELDPASGAAERHLRAALGDSDPRLVALCIQRLSDLASTEAVEILGSFLEGSLPCGPPPLAQIRRIVKGMLAVEPIGLERVCKGLDALRTSLKPVKARVGAAIRQSLEGHGQDPPVARCLARWRRSPAWLVSLLMSAPAPEPREDRE